MADGIAQLTAQASTGAGSIDFLFWVLTAISTVVIGAITLAALYFVVKYRKGSGANRRHHRSEHRLEPWWAAGLLTIFLLLFVWGAGLYAYIDYLSPPKDAMEVYVVGKQWMWKIQHANGKREIDTLHVPRGEPVKLVMISEDVIHSFFVPAFRVKHDVLPGSYSTLWFQATETGEFPFFCAEYCGTGHSKMTGKVVVMEPEAYAEWLRRGSVSTSLAAKGKQLFQDKGCSGCHGPESAVNAPRLEGLYGSTVTLSNGSSVQADDRYIRDSILKPKKQVVAGFQPIMPSFQGQLSERELLQLIAYVKSLGSQSESSP